MNEPLARLVRLLASFCAVIVVLTLHEFAHAFVAYRCGDPTPKWNHRLSLNPFRHFDLIGLICFTLVGFGWAKPVPINPYNFKHQRRGLFLTSAAGIVMNLITAFLIFPLVLVVLYYLPYVTFLSDLIYDIVYLIYAYSLCFAIFNLLPLYPLDGFRIVDALNRRRGKVFRFLRDYGRWILLGLIAESFLCTVFSDYLHVAVMENFNLLGWLSHFAVNYVGYPIQRLWGLLPW